MPNELWIAGAAVDGETSLYRNYSLTLVVLLTDLLDCDGFDRFSLIFVRTVTVWRIFGWTEAVQQFDGI